MTPSRVQLDLGLEPVDVLRRLRGAERVAALIGEWHQGEALIACDPIRVTTVADDPFEVVDESQAGWWIGAWGYRLGNRLESLPEVASRPVPQPEHRLALYDVVLRLVDGAWFVEHVPEADPSPLIARLSTAAATKPFEVGTLGST